MSGLVDYLGVLGVLWGGGGFWLTFHIDNLGLYKEYVHEDTVEDVSRYYPRCQWSKCFSGKLREEIALKPWCHSTALGENAPRDIENNALMEPYDGRC